MYLNVKVLCKKSIKMKWLLCSIILIMVLLSGCGSDTSNKEDKEDKENIASKECEVMINVRRTGNLLTNIGDLDVWIDGEQVFSVKGDSENSVKLKMIEGEHTIQTKGQGDKSKVLKFYVSEGGGNEFYFNSEISNVLGVDLQERNYIPQE